MNAFYLGVAAGFGAAVPVGAAGIALMETSMRYGLARGIIGGLGIALVDSTYAAIAVAIGAPAAEALAPYRAVISLLGGLVICAVGGYGLRHGVAEMQADVVPPRGTTLRAFGTMAMLTAVNPLTIAFFVGLILAAPEETFAAPGSQAQFVLGVGLACLSWETVLAAIGAFGGRKAGLALKQKLSKVGNGLVLALGIAMALLGALLLLGFDSLLPEALRSVGHGHASQQ